MKRRLIRDTDPIYAPGSEMLRHQTQIQITLQTALLCEAMGLRRKFAFYMQRAARLYRHSYCWPACHAFSMLAARVYGVKGIDSEEPGQAQHVSLCASVSDLNDGVTVRGLFLFVSALV